MKMKINVVIPILLICTSFSALSAADYRKNPQITLAYWNDNFIYQDFFRKFLKVGNDDFVTTSIWSQVAYQRPQNWLITDFYYNILTNKNENYRFDLVTVRLSIEKDTPRALLQIGTGLVIQGNYGGATIQNTYHQLFGYHTVNLSYINKNTTGLLFLTKIEPYLIKTANHTLKVSAINIYRTTAGPSNFRFGISAIQKVAPQSSKICFYLHGRLGYFHYYTRDDLTKPLFNEGLGYGLIISGVYRHRYGVSLWATENQYGQHYPHYGLRFTFNPRRRFVLLISDIMVP